LPGPGPEAFQAFQSLAIRNALSAQALTPEPEQEAHMRIILIAFAVAAIPPLALAQSWTATTGTTQPTTTAPASNTPRIAEPKTKIPPAARSGEKGLRVGEGADAGQVE